MRIPRSSAVVLVALSLAACGDAPGRITAAGEPSQVVVPPPVCVTFDPFAVGSTGGGAVGDLPGTVKGVENGIPVSVHVFYHPGGATSFNLATLTAALPGFGAGNIANTNNINLGFDFTGLPFVPSAVKFAWRDYGGHENLRVNGSPFYVGELIAAPSPWGGAAVSHVWAWGGGGAFKQGTTTLTGPVSVLGVGGQEFYLENVCAYP